MGSVIDSQECINCRQEATIDYYYKTGEEYIFCMHCGYYKSCTIKNREKKLSELTDDDWELKEIANPYGCYRIKSKEHIATECGVLESDEMFNELKSTIMEDWDNVDFCTVSRFIDGEIVVTHLK